MGDALALETPLWEIFARASILYIALNVLLRLVPKRQTGSLSPNDMIALVIIGTLGADAIAGGSQSLLDLLLMVLIIMLWDYLFNLAEYYIPPYRKFAQHSPTLLIHNGILIEKNLRREKLTEEELLENLRLSGVPEIAEVWQAVLEADGQISVIKKE